MESSRRAVESYWRSRMIDGATSDEDKVTPVYKLEEICELLRSSPVGIVKEVSEFILKRLQHKSPIVKQKALRVIKYAIGKSGAEFRREMQRNSVSIRQLIHYKGQPDPLKGDSLNKAVRETAQEALSVLFSSSDDIKPAPTENLGGRIQGFGNTNFEMPSEDKKSFISEVVGIGSATIKHGINSLTQSPSLKKNDTGSYRGPNLKRSLTRETDYSDRYEGISYNESQNSSGFSRNTGSQSWGQDLKTSHAEMTSQDMGLSSGEKTREERLLDTIATAGGVRLQPTRDALQAFLAEASKLDALAITRALESKLQSPSWQVRVKAICVLEAILRKKDDEHFSIIASYFSENNDVVVKCSESPQASLREKANKVLSLLDVGEATGQTEQNAAHSDKLSKVETVQMPDLIDTGDSDILFGTDDSVQMQSNENLANTSTSTAPLIDDLFGIGTSANTSEQKNDDDPFADVSFHNATDKDPESDIFSGMTFDKPGSAEIHQSPNGNGPEPFGDIFGSSSEISKAESIPKRDVEDLMSGLSLNGFESSSISNGSSGGRTLENILPNSNPNPDHKVSHDIFNNMLQSQVSGSSTNPMFPLGGMPYNMPPGYVFNPAFASQALNSGAMGNLFAQQQFLAAMSTFQQMGSLQQTAGINPASGSNGGYDSALPDIFNANVPTQAPTSLMNSQKKEDTRAFDFISDHLAAARDPKRVI